MLESQHKYVTDQRPGLFPYPVTSTIHQIITEMLHTPSHIVRKESQIRHKSRSGDFWGRLTCYETHEGVFRGLSKLPEIKTSAPPDLDKGGSGTFGVNFEVEDFETHDLL